MEDNIKLSIICNTYNHERYIEDALNSFLRQKCDFRYEILIHDDASTDNTQKIIKDFQKRYPEIVKPIFQKENQYSKNIRMSEVFQYPRVRGDYIAFCEGDDYWIDGNKLKKQVDFLDRNPNIDICAHGAQMVVANTKEIIGTITPAKNDIIFTLDDVILGGGGFVATNSLVYRSQLTKNLPSFRKYLALDYSMQIYGSLRGGMGYLSEVMSSYRVLSDSSWTMSMQRNPEKYVEHIEKVNRMLDILDVDTQFKYSKVIEKEKIINEIEILKTKKDYKSIFSDRYLCYRKELSLKEYIKLVIKRLLYFS